LEKLYAFDNYTHPHKLSLPDRRTFVAAGYTNNIDYARKSK